MYPVKKDETRNDVRKMPLFDGIKWGRWNAAVILDTHQTGQPEGLPGLIFLQKKQNLKKIVTIPTVGVL